MSLFELIYELLKKLFKCERDYASKYNTGTADHIGFSLFAATLICGFGFICIWLLLLYPLAWGYYAPFKELVIDKEKQKHQPKEWIKAQLIERTSGFVLMLPFLIITVIYKLWII